ASQDDRYTETFLWVGGAFLVSLALLALATAAAIRSDADRRRGERRFRTLVQESADVISVVDGTGMHQYVSPSTLAVMGYRPEELAGRPYQELLNPDDVERAMRIHRAIIQNPAQEVRFETRLRHADNTWHWHEIVARNMLADPTIRGIVFNHRDVTERRRFADQLAHEASHDALTGLANRAVFLQDLAQALLSADGLTWHTGVLFLDLNDFKGINDSWGHETGDAVLVTTAQVLQASVRGSDTVARVGGDEFGIVLAKIDEPRNAEDVAQRIISGLIKPIDAAGHTLQVSLSIGIAIQDQDTHDPDELLRQADLAMYKAKRCKGNSYQMFRADLDTAHTAGTPTVRELETAIAQQQLYLEYQPIVAIASGELLGAEALVRWRHPTLGTLGPLAFIPLAEDSGLIKPLGAWVLRSACAQVRRWQQGWSGDRGLALSVNLSPQQLEVPDLVDQVLRILDETGFAPHDLALEITENALVKEDIAIRVLAQLHDHGIRLALDDFGTGYSSLRYLTNLPVDILKLDRCFVTELDGTPEGSAVAEAVIRLSHVLRIDAIAEGIEDVGQANELAQLGYAVAQGYHFAKPLGPEAFEAILNQAVPRLPVVLDGPGVTCSAGGGPPRSSA
ncbi:MAG: EAL domain-containing protein, partial [Micromonosporaceae bacterium]|nr:EAL domain-containing protein [Micromonosporaceae bacterium]